jgi:hypothetical protein
MIPYPFAALLLAVLFATPALADGPVYGPLPYQPPPVSGSTEKHDWLVVKGQSAMIECYGGSPTVYSRHGKVLDRLPEAGGDLYLMDGRAEGGSYLASGRYTVMCPDGARNTVIWVK